MAPFGGRQIRAEHPLPRKLTMRSAPCRSTFHKIGRSTSELGLSVRVSLALIAKHEPVLPSISNGPMLLTALETG